MIACARWIVAVPAAMLFLLLVPRALRWARWMLRWCSCDHCGKRWRRWRGKARVTHVERNIPAFVKLGPRVYREMRLLCRRCYGGKGGDA